MMTFRIDRTLKFSRAGNKIEGAERDGDGMMDGGMMILAHRVTGSFVKWNTVP